MSFWFKQQPTTQPIQAVVPKVITPKAVVYLRTSTFDQDPELQKSECLQLAATRGYEVYGVFTEQLSGYKDIQRPKYDEVKELARQGRISAVIVWGLDRWIRNRDSLLQDITLLKQYNVKLHTVKDSWVEAVNIEGPIGRTIQDFLLGLLGSIAEEESRTRSLRVKAAHANHTGHWGRKSLPQSVGDEILLKHNQGLTLRQIATTTCYYDGNRNKRRLSLGAVHKVIKKSRLANASLISSS